MSKRAPSTTQLLVIAGFALSCFGILLFLWVTFGGPTPFKAKPYEIKVPFNEATQLAEQSDVRISGVNVGKVQNIDLAPNGKQALATVDIDDKYAPLPESTRGRSCAPRPCSARPTSNSRPASRDGPELADGGTLPEANVAESVQLDEIFRTFDPETRAAFQELDAGSGGRDRRPGPEPLLRARRARTDLHRIRQALPRPRHASGSRSSSCSATAPPPSSALRGREGELAEPDPAAPTPSSRRPPRATATSKRSSAPSRPSRTSRG